MDLKISDLPPQFENIAMEHGIDRIKALFRPTYVLSEKSRHMNF